MHLDIFYTLRASSELERMGWEKKLRHDDFR